MLYKLTQGAVYLSLGFLGGSWVYLQHAAAVAAAAPRRQLTAWRFPVSVRLQEDGVRLQPHPLYRRSSES